MAALGGGWYVTLSGSFSSKVQNAGGVGTTAGVFFVFGFPRMLLPRFGTRGVGSEEGGCWLAGFAACESSGGLEGGEVFESRNRGDSNTGVDLLADGEALEHTAVCAWESGIGALIFVRH